MPTRKPATKATGTSSTTNGTRKRDPATASSSSSSDDAESSPESAAATPSDEEAEASGGESGSEASDEEEGDEEMEDASSEPADSPPVVKLAPAKGSRKRKAAPVVPSSSSSSEEAEPTPSPEPEGSPEVVSSPPVAEEEHKSPPHKRRNNGTATMTSSGRIKKAPSRPDESDDESKEAASARRKRPKTSTTPPIEPMDPDELPDEWRCSANDALTFRLVRSAPERETAQQSGQVEPLNFHPTYTHQLWDEEEIVGYKKVKALVSFTSGALYTYIKVEYEEKHGNTDVPDIQSLIASKLRGGYTLDYEDFKSHIHDPFVPPGELLAEYTVPSVEYTPKETITYEVYCGRFDSATMRAYHQRLQFFLLFFIDRSSFINDGDLVWEIILLFQKRVCLAKQVTTYNIVGYTTLYKFLAYPSDWKMRLSQILILPPYQRAGHGQKLLQLVYAEAERRHMIEVNIEDPSPVFQMLRDLTDINLCRKGRFFEKQPGSDVDPLEKWDLTYASVVKASLRITLAQVRRCYEIFRLNGIADRHKNSRAMIAYRLEVKGRIYKEEQEVLSLYSQKTDQRKEKLAEIYNELEQHYQSVIKKARLH